MKQRALQLLVITALVAAGLASLWLRRTLDIERGDREKFEELAASERETLRRELCAAEKCAGEKIRSLAAQLEAAEGREREARAALERLERLGAELAAVRTQAGDLTAGLADLKGRVEEGAAARKALAEQVAAVALLAQAIQAEVAKVGAAQAGIQAEVAKVGAAQGAAGEQAAKLEAALGALASQIQSQIQEKLDGLAARLEAQKGELEALQAKRAGEIAARFDKVEEAEAKAREERQAIAAELAGLRVELGRVSSSTPAALAGGNSASGTPLLEPVRPATAMEADVVLVDLAKRVAVLGRGADGGVVEGQVFEVVRDGAVVAELQVVKIYPNMAGARILRLQEGATLEKGDVARSGPAGGEGAEKLTAGTGRDAAPPVPPPPPPQ